MGTWWPMEESERRQGRIRKKTIDVTQARAAGTVGAPTSAEKRLALALHVTTRAESDQTARLEYACGEKASTTQKNSGKAAFTALMEPVTSSRHNRTVQSEEEINSCTMNDSSDQCQSCAVHPRKKHESKSFQGRFKNVQRIHNQETRVSIHTSNSSAQHFEDWMKRKQTRQKSRYLCSIRPTTADLSERKRLSTAALSSVRRAGRGCRT